MLRSVWANAVIQNKSSRLNEESNRLFAPRLQETVSACIGRRFPLGKERGLRFPRCVIQDPGYPVLTLIFLGLIASALGSVSVKTPCFMLASILV